MAYGLDEKDAKKLGKISKRLGADARKKKQIQTMADLKARVDEKVHDSLYTPEELRVQQTPPKMSAPRSLGELKERLKALELQELIAPLDGSQLP